MNSATSALHIALEMTDYPFRAQVLVPTMTFASTGHIVKHAGLDPIFCDVHEYSLLLNEWDASNKLNINTKALIYVLYGGQHPSAHTLIYNKEVPIIWDCAHACGNTMFSAKGKLCCWSFHAVKNLSCGDGGMLTTDDKDQAERTKRLRWLGIDKSTHDRERGGYSWDYSIDEIGYKYHMNDLTAAIGIVQLEKMFDMQRKRRELVWRYICNLETLTFTHLQLPKWSNEHSWHLFVIRTHLRDELSTYLRSKLISTGVHYRPIHLYKCYGQQPSLPVAEAVWPTLLTLPLFPDLTLKEIDMICEHIHDFFRANHSQAS
jgi:perosamine synthetase